MTQTPEQLASLAATMAATNKVNAEAAQVRSAAEIAEQAAKDKRQADLADVEAKRIANESARAQAADAHLDKVIERLNGAIPDLASLGKSEVTFGEGRALRQGEAIALALDEVATTIAETVSEAIPAQGIVFVVSDPRLVGAIAVYRQLAFEATILDTELTKACRKAAEFVSPSLKHMLSLDAATAVASVAGKAINQLASLAEVDVDITEGTFDVPASTLQAAVMAKLLKARPRARTPGAGGLEVRHESARIPTEGSALLAAIEKLTELDVEVAKLSAGLKTRVAKFGSPEADIDAAQRILDDDKKSDAEHEKARKDKDAAIAAQGECLGVQTALDDLTAISGKAVAFVERITAVPAAGASVLASALAIEPVTTGDDNYVLALEGAKADVYQVVVKRRIFAPRLQTSTSVAADFLLVKGAALAAAGHITESATYLGVIKRFGAGWKPGKGLKLSQK